MKKDIKLSKNILGELSGKEVNIFSYSHGHYSEQSLKILEEFGFKYAVSIEPRAVSKKDKPLLLPRYDTNDLKGFINNV